MPVSKKKKFNDTINKWLNKLIDLSRRNRQLYFRRTKASTVELIQPDDQEIFDMLVNRRKKMTIIYRDIDSLNRPKQDLTDFMDEKIEEEPLTYSKPLKSGEILTDKEDKELYKILRNLSSRSRSSFQEQGVNILFLSFGFLQWKDIAFSDSINSSPLILVPVILERTSLLQPYKLKFFDDDILLNPALALKLENDFKIKLPQFSEEIEAIETYFSEIESTLNEYSETRSWKIVRDVYLSFFSFSKLVMYRDIKDNIELIKNHKILNNLIEEKSNEQIVWLSGEELDQIDSKETFHILDADSSQQNVILNAEQGKTFTVQGPPGTGKSQTIANIIATSLAREKTVLFVSEKMAALEVVMKRLEECGFANFCLGLHSYKTKKKTVFEELGSCLLDKKEYKNPRLHFLKELTHDRELLNNYFKTLRQTYSPFDISAYYIHGKLVELADVTFYPKYNLRIENLSRKMFSRVIETFKKIDILRPLFKNYNDNPWYGFDISNLTFEFRNSVIFEFDETIDTINQLEKFSIKIKKAISSTKLLNFFQIINFYEYSINQNIDFLLYDIENILQRFSTKYKSFIRILKSEYRKDVKKIRFLLEIDEKLKYIDIKQILEEALNYKKLLQVPNSLNWESINVEIQKQQIIQFDQEFYNILSQEIKNYTTRIKYLRILFPKIDSKVFDINLEKVSFEKMLLWLKEKIDKIDKIDDWNSIDSLRIELKELNVENLFFTSLKYETRIVNLEKSFEKFIYNIYLDYIYSKNPILRKFRSLTFDSALENFKNLDKKHINISRKRLQYILSNLRPKTQWVMADSSDINILKKEIIKKRRIKPIRLLFSQIPNLVKSLKPCFLMSPLSISKYLNPEIYKFDIVIFDEASQVRPEDSIGAIMRGSQVIIVGDQKQLPPTTFFQALSDDNYEDYYEDVDFESILESFSLSNFPNLLLEHHYRSRDESLIAFSNYHFYDNQLYTYPAIYHNKDNLGIEFEYVHDGIYDRGKSRTNKVEAIRVAELILHHFKTDPELSLGVIAFSQAQQNAIGAALEHLIRQEIQYEKYIQKGDLEHFFIKNLENVQGDERDVMFFSIGYGKDIDGKLSLNFGPLNRVGGERRLNVAITRARYKVKIISSIYAREIDVSRTQSKGLKLLKQYIEYAENKGELSYIKERNTFVDEEFDSPFEIEVYKALKNLGYDVHTQIGSSGFKIDLGVVHPRFPGQYILGIECDGSQYHSSFTARDRDRIRQKFLESLGWKIYRIWSYDWITNRQKEINKISKLIEKLKNSKNSPIKRKKENLDSVSFEKSKNFNLQEFQQSFENKSKKRIDFNNLPEDFTQYKKYNKAHPNIFVKYRSYDGYSLRRSTPVITNIVKMESPIHINELCKRICQCCNISRLGPSMKSDIYSYIRNSRDMYQSTNTVWKKNQSQIPVRYPSSNENKRQIINIPAEEIAQALVLLLRDSLSLSEYETVLYTGKIFGFTSVSGKSKEYILKIIDSLFENGYIAKDNGKYLLKRKNSYKIMKENIKWS